YMGGCLLNENLTWGSVLLASSALPPDPALVGERWRALWLARLDHAVLFPEVWLRHQRRDAYWRHTELERITCAVYAVGGWADAAVGGARRRRLVLLRRRGRSHRPARRRRRIAHLRLGAPRRAPRDSRRPRCRPGAGRRPAPGLPRRPPERDPPRRLLGPRDLRRPQSHAPREPRASRSDRAGAAIQGAG